jgi:TFIIF-interacting CTD phosphatase-like protein
LQEQSGLSQVSQPNRKLLVLDLDETLVYATEDRLDRAEDFRVASYYVYIRPHLQDFVAFVLETFRVGVWTTSGEMYATQVVERIFEPGALDFIWSSERCTPARDRDTREYHAIKNLRKLKDRGYSLESIIVVDDTATNYARNYGNLVIVREYSGDRNDDELLHLASYLKHLASAPNVRTVEKRHWREQIRNLGSR